MFLGRLDMALIETWDIGSDHLARSFDKANYANLPADHGLVQQMGLDFFQMERSR